MGAMRRTSAAALRNLRPLLAALREALPASGTLLELGSGTGEHAIAVARAFPGLAVVPSDPDPVARASIAAWAAEARLPNLAAPLDLDLLADAWTRRGADALLCVNVLHVAAPAAVEALVRGAARVLPPRGPLVVAAPFFRRGARRRGRLLRFDGELRAADPALGIRDLEDLVEAGARHGLVAGAPRALPAEGDLLVVLVNKGSSAGAAG
jgi:SAM-dependent methyltransferase